MLARYKAKLKSALNALAYPLAKVGVNPNALTLSGLALALLAVLAARSGVGPIFVFALLALSSLLDALDGALARITSKVTRFGAFLDSTTDRLSDAMFDVALYEVGLLSPYELLTLLVAEYLISYTRARAEGLGVKMEGVGLMERGERVLLKAVALLLTPYAEVARLVLYTLIILSLLTVVQRISYVARALG